jgi:hypothetical protein
LIPLRDERNAMPQLLSAITAIRRAEQDIGAICARRSFVIFYIIIGRKGTSMVIPKSLVIVLASVLLAGAGSIAFSQVTHAASVNSSPGVPPGLTAADAAEYDSVIFTNTTPEQAVTRLKEKILEFEAEAAEAAVAGSADEVASALDHAQYLTNIVQLICTQEAPTGC